MLSDDRRGKEASFDNEVNSGNKSSLTFILFTILGIGALFPWNAFILVIDYYSLKYKPTNFPASFFLPMVYNWPNMITILLLLKFRSYFPIKLRLIFGFFLQFFVFVAVTTLDGVIKSSLVVSLVILFICVALCGASSAILNGSLSELNSMFPSKYITATMTGNGIAGIITFLLRVITKLAFESGIESISDAEKLKLGFKSLLVYFIICCVVLIISFLSIFILYRIPLVKYYLKRGSVNTKRHDIEENSEKIVSKPKFKTVIGKIYPHCIWMIITFFITLSLFPGLLIKVPASYRKLDNWIFIVLVGTFIVFDFVGRLLPKFLSSYNNGKIKIFWIPPSLTFIPTIVRFSFYIPFFMMVLPLDNPLISNNIIGVFILFLFAVTNGLFAALPMIYAPQAVDDHEKGLAGSIMAVSLNIGIFLGSNFAILLDWLIDPGSFKIFGH